MISEGLIERLKKNISSILPLKYENGEVIFVGSSFVAPIIRSSFVIR
jgi:hypothetical protein